MLSIYKNKRKWIVIAGITLALLVVIVSNLGEEKPQFETAIVIRGDLLEEVSVTGRVEPSRRVDLAFEKTGRISRVYKNVGDAVSGGQLLVQLENSDTLAELTQAEAQIKIERARLNNLLKGSRDEEIEIKKVKVSNAQSAINEIYTSVQIALDVAYTNADDAVRNKVDQFISNPKSATPGLNFIITSQQLETSIEQGRVAVEAIFSGWLRPMPSPDQKESIHIVNTYLLEIKDFLDDVALAVNTLTPHSTLTGTTINGYKNDVSTARTNVNTAISGLASSEEELVTAESVLYLTEQELVLAEAGATKEDIDAQVAAVESAEASMNVYQAQLDKLSLRAPISGIVTIQDAKVGEIVSAGSNLVSIITNSAFKIEANIPEADIASLSIGNIAAVTLDAYRDDVFFEAIVARIDPAETIIDGVATYKTTLEFKENDERVKSGMTANIDIMTSERIGVLYIPSRAVLGAGSQKIVRVVNVDSYEEVIVTTGLRGIDGNIEIIDGLEEGDEIIVFILD